MPLLSNSPHAWTLRNMSTHSLSCDYLTPGCSLCFINVQKPGTFVSNMPQSPGLLWQEAMTLSKPFSELMIEVHCESPVFSLTLFPSALIVSYHCVSEKDQESWSCFLYLTGFHCSYNIWKPIFPNFFNIIFSLSKLPVLTSWSSCLAGHMKVVFFCCH